MKVRELMSELLEKDPDDVVELEVKVNLCINDRSVNKVERSVPVTDVAGGNIQRDVKGNIIEDMCCEGVLMSGGTFFVSCDRCVSVSFGSGSEAYDITTIDILEERWIKKYQIKSLGETLESRM